MFEYVKRALYVYMSKELCTSVKSALYICQKSSIYMSKELYKYVKRALYICVM